MTRPEREAAICLVAAIYTARTGMLAVRSALMGMGLAEEAEEMSVMAGRLHAIEVEQRQVLLREAAA